MMGHQSPPQSKLFYEGVSLDQRVRRNHPLRRINEIIDFDFSYDEVKGKYGYNGNVLKQGLWTERKYSWIQVSLRRTRRTTPLSTANLYNDTFGKGIKSSRIV